MRKYSVHHREMALQSQIWGDNVASRPYWARPRRSPCGVFRASAGLLGRVEGDLDVLLVDALLYLGGGGQRAPVGLEQRI